jgi:hypothetical protein
MGLSHLDRSIMGKSTNLRLNQWTLLAALAVVLLAMGAAGFTRYAAWYHQTRTLWDNLYLTLQLIPLNSGTLKPPLPVELELARVFIPILTAVATIKAFWELFRQQMRMLRLGRLRGHIVICGLSRKGLLLANQFRRLGDEVVIIERDEKK